jgi:hypothetical protein
LKHCRILGALCAPSSWCVNIEKNVADMNVSISCRFSDH